MKTYARPDKIQMGTLNRKTVKDSTRSQNCPRCHGFIIREDFCDTKDSCSPLWITGIRCTNCGFIGDALVLYHHTIASKDEAFPQPRRRRGHNRLDPIRK